MNFIDDESESCNQDDDYGYEDASGRYADDDYGRTYSVAECVDEAMANILQRAGPRHAAEIVRTFRQRDANTDAWLWPALEKYQPRFAVELRAELAEVPVR